MKKVGIYARVSRHEQQTLPLQIKALKAYVQQRRWRLVLQSKEVGSGATERPQRAALLQAARRRDIDVIVVWRLDRWGRSLAELVGTLKELTELGVGFVSKKEKEVRRLFAQGLSKSEIARRVGIGRTSVRRLLA